MRSDRIAQIVEVRKRHGRAQPHRMAARARLNTVKAEWEFVKSNIPDGRTNIRSYFPVSVVTALEVFLRLVIRDIIDHGPPFSERAEGIAGNIKFDLRTIHALQGRTVTLGEVISYSQSLSQVGTILKTISTLIGEDCKNLLACQRDRFGVEVAKHPDVPIIKDIDKTCSAVDNLLRTHNIIVHELPKRVPFSTSDIDRFINHTEEFIRAVDCLTSDLLEPGSPLTQAEMNAAQVAALREAEEEMNEVLGLVRAKMPEDQCLIFDRSQKAWELFREENARAYAQQSYGGTMYSFLYFSTLREVTETRTEHLRSRYNVLSWGG